MHQEDHLHAAFHKPDDGIHPSVASWLSLYHNLHYQWPDVSQLQPYPVFHQPV
jgi:hypothetical protein